jgi:hypothetical protein
MPPIPAAKPIETLPRTSEMPTVYADGRECGCGKELNRYNVGPSCYGCQDRVADLLPIDIAALIAEAP